MGNSNNIKLQIGTHSHMMFYLVMYKNNMRFLLGLSNLILVIYELIIEILISNKN